MGNSKDKKLHSNLYYIFQQDHEKHPVPPSLVSKIQQKIHVILLHGNKIKNGGE